MSRAYRVNWVTASSTVTTSDTLTMGVSLLGILPGAEMAAMRHETLQPRIFKT
jgi:urease accessory protein UreF